MSFQKYCDLINDDQKVKAEKTLLLTYTNSKGEAFSISPESIKLFLLFLLDNYEVVHTAWATVESRKDYIYQYEEKSYREIYKSVSNEELKVISSTGRSQTKALTKLIAKIIGFLTESPYESPEVNTFFEEESLRLALHKWSDFVGMDFFNKEKLSDFNIKEKFKLWMINKGLSQKTASSYSGSGITYCDKYINHISPNVYSFYQLKSEQVLDALKELQKISEWLQADKSGNSMYSSACKKLAEFLAEKSYISYTSLPKPFLLLAGISGTGKTRFVRKQAEARGLLSSTYCLTSVRPDWHEPSDLLGYVSRLGEHAEYITTDVLAFMAQAWRAIADNENLNIECVDSDGQGKRLVVSGKAEALEDVPPYWLCLDEMNLAPVEQYFADYLSVLETREWCWDSGDSFRYSCDALLKPSFLQLNGENGAEQAYNTKLRESLKLADSKYDDLWHCFCEYGLPIPFNLIVAGTVNMDETTHGFSRKVIDRAMSFDFGEFFPNEIDEFFEGDQKKSANTLSYPILSHVRNIEEFSAVEADSDASKTKAFFKAINNVLKNTPFELAFRAFNELCLSVICFAPKTDTELAAVFDDYLMCKVLPRIEGDEDKVRTSQGHNLLEQLTEVFQEQLTTILPNHESISRPDLLRHFEGETAEKVEVEWRSEKKLKAMTAQLNNGFCSFWP
ncbi:McrB family protein [Vibrio cholerae]|uniref:McrB family protein n=1 Tax=Vibrio cholerae TaxID=666 RepID=UPI001F07FA93|nr:hypothetical protein [Vibrio cholerae]